MPAPSQKVAQFAQLRDGHAIRVVVDKENVLVIRDGNRVHAYSADCPHAGGPLEEGAICNGHIVCPWHKGTFALANGDLLEPPPLAALDRYPVSIDGDDVMVTPEKLPVRAPAGSNDARVFAIIGAGAAGGAACAALRERGFAGRIVLIGKEAAAPYDRTSLSKFVLSGEMKPDDVPALLPADFIGRERIERIESAVARLDVKSRRIHFDDGRELDYDTALLASGSEPAVPDIPGCELGNVHVLRSLDNSRTIVDAVHEHSRVVILGSSFIGLESASALRKRNVAVTVVAPTKIPFAKQFGERIGTMFRTLHETNGVQFRLNEKVSSLAGDTAVREVVLESGERIPADVVLLGTGVKPVTGFVEGIALQKDGGIAADARMQAAPGLYVAGDIAVFPLHDGEPAVRIEHWRVAQQHALIAAHNMCGASERYASVPFFWTYHYEKNFEYLGHASQWDDIVFDGDPDQHAFLALFVKNGKVAAAVACQRDRETARLIEFMRNGLTVDEALRIAREA